ncbi:MAG: 50S ribosomal protein L22 [Candidatus Micrarchaeia archaeon]
MAMGYSYQFKEDEKVAKAQLVNINASYKDLCNTCAFIRGLNAKEALSLLELASKKVIPIPYPRYNKKLGHRRELGGKKGRYPVKSAKIVARVLKDAIANARFLGMNEENLYVAYAVANKHRIEKRIAPKGPRRAGKPTNPKRGPRYSNLEFSFVQIVLKEKEEKEKKEEKGNEKETKTKEVKEKEEKNKEKNKEVV